MDRIYLKLLLYLNSFVFTRVGVYCVTNEKSATQCSQQTVFLYKISVRFTTYTVRYRTVFLFQYFVMLDY